MNSLGERRKHTKKVTWTLFNEQCLIIFDRNQFLIDWLFIWFLCLPSADFMLVWSQVTIDVKQCLKIGCFHCWLEIICTICYWKSANNEIRPIIGLFLPHCTHSDVWIFNEIWIFLNLLEYYENCIRLSSLKWHCKLNVLLWRFGVNTNNFLANYWKMMKTVRFLLRKCRVFIKNRSMCRTAYFHTSTTNDKMFNNSNRNNPHYKMRCSQAI